MAEIQQHADLNILVTGGAGYIGSHAVRELVQCGARVTVLDNLSNGHRESVPRDVRLIIGDVGDTTLVRQILRDEKIDAVLHFAAFIEVGESVKEPLKYYRNNFSCAISLLEAMRVEGVKKLVFSSTAAVYGNPLTVPIQETALRSPINPYGRSKMMTELAIEDACAADGLGYAILRYFNVAGASEDASIGEAHEPESHLIPRVLQAARDGRRVGIFGTDYETRDGTCVRDYVHVVDLVRAHIVALQAIKDGQGQIYNVGSENGFSVKEVVETCRQVTGLKIEAEVHPRRPGDPDSLIASSSKIRALGWIPRYPDLSTIVAHAWKWHVTHPRGFKT